MHTSGLRLCRTGQDSLRHQVLGRVQRPGGELGQGLLQEIHQPEERQPQSENPSCHRRVE